MSGRERRRAEELRHCAEVLRRAADEQCRRAEEAKRNEAARLRKERDELIEANKRLSRGYDVPKLQVNQHVTNVHVEQHVHVNQYPRQPQFCPPQTQFYPPQPQFYASAIKSGAARGRRARGFEHGDRAFITNNLRGEQGTTGTVTRVTACQVTITDDRGNEYTRNFQNMRKIP